MNYFRIGAQVHRQSSIFFTSCSACKHPGRGTVWYKCWYLRKISRPDMICKRKSDQERNTDRWLRNVSFKLRNAVNLNESWLKMGTNQWPFRVFARSLYLARPQWNEMIVTRECWFRRIGGTAVETEHGLAEAQRFGRLGQRHQRHRPTRRHWQHLPCGAHLAQGEIRTTT